jgi:hypothetical protein
MKAETPNPDGPFGCITTKDLQIACCMGLVLIGAASVLHNSQAYMPSLVFLDLVVLECR